MSDLTVLIGSWQSVRSNIPGYKPGTEWLHFGGEANHQWEVGQPDGKGRPVVTPIALEKAGSGYRLFVMKAGIAVGPPAQIEVIGADEINVTPAHGFVTTFRNSKQS